MANPNVPNPDSSGVLGLEQLLGVLRELPGNLQKNALTSIARAGAVQLKKDAMVQLGLVLNRTVRDDDIIVKQRRRQPGEVRAEYNVGPPTRKPQLRWLHNGTDPHRINTTHAGVLASSDQVFGDNVVHPGQVPQPWLERAYFLSRDRQVKAMAKTATKAIARQARILNTKKYRNARIKNIRYHFAGGRLFG